MDAEQEETERLKLQLKATREERIGQTAADILLSFDTKPGDFLTVKNAENIHNVALALYGEPAETGEECP